MVRNRNLLLIGWRYSLIVHGDMQLHVKVRIKLNEFDWRYLLDVSAAYPSNQCVFNVSKETTKKEMTSIEGIDLYTQKMQGINLSSGHTNSLEFCQTMFKFPTLEVLLEDFNNKKMV